MKYLSEFIKEKREDYDSLLMPCQISAVVVRGHEGGVDDAIAVERHEIALDYYLPEYYYYGRHEFASEARGDTSPGWGGSPPVNKAKSDCEIREAVFIKSNSRFGGHSPKALQELLSIDL